MEKVDFIDAMAKEAHSRCPLKDHTYEQHLPTCDAYAQQLFPIDHSVVEIIDTIWNLGHVDGVWTGHPYPTAILEVLNNGS